MKRIRKGLLTLSMVVCGGLACLSMAACGNTAKYVFQTNGGTAIETVEVEAPAGMIQYKVVDIQRSM